MSNKIIFREALSNKKKELVFLVNSLLNVLDSGVYVLFDNADYLEYPNITWRNEAVFMNAKFGIEEMSPSHILKIMEKDDCQYFIWISKSACNSDDVTFTWVYSHELQHLSQEIKFPELSGVGNFLRKAIPKIQMDEPKLQITIPTEYDAERIAKCVITKIFGSSVCDKHIEDEINTGNKPECFKVIKQIDLTKPYDVFAETLKLIMKYRDKFQRQQLNSLGNNLIRKFDIEAFIFLCKEKQLGST